MSEGLEKKLIDEIEHGKWLVENDPVMQWGWGTPAGKLRAERRAKCIAEMACLRPGMKVMEIGCGTGMFTEKFAHSGAEILAVDLSEDLLELAQKRQLPDNVVFKRIQFENCSESGPFDAIIGSSVLHHLLCPAAFKRIFDLLKPGGRMSFAEPNYLNPQVWFCLRYRKWFPEFSPEETAFVRWPLKGMLEGVGFTNVRITPFDWLHPAVPSFAIPTVKFFQKGIERIPFLREFSGSLMIGAEKDLQS